MEYARNPRKNDTAVDRMCASMRRFGFMISCLVRSDGELDVPEAAASASVAGWVAGLERGVRLGSATAKALAVWYVKTSHSLYSPGRRGKDGVVSPRGSGAVGE